MHIASHLESGHLSAFFHPLAWIYCRRCTEHKGRITHFYGIRRQRVRSGQKVVIFIILIYAQHIGHSSNGITWKSRFILHCWPINLSALTAARAECISKKLDASCDSDMNENMTGERGGQKTAQNRNGNMRCRQIGAKTAWRLI